MVSYRSVYDCWRPANADADACAFQNDNAYFYSDINQPAYRHGDDHAITRAYVDGDTQPDADGHPHPAANFDDVAVAHAPDHGYALAQPDQACGDERALIGV